MPKLWPSQPITPAPMASKPHLTSALRPESHSNPLISATLHTLNRGPSSLPAGNRPERTPAHQVARETGITAGIPRRGHPII